MSMYALSRVSDRVVVLNLRGGEDRKKENAGSGVPSRRFASCFMRSYSMMVTFRKTDLPLLRTWTRYKPLPTAERSSSVFSSQLDKLYSFEKMD